jgi:hypothetical protein
MWRNVDNPVTPHTGRAKVVVNVVENECGQMCMTLKKPDDW